MALKLSIWWALKRLRGQRKIERGKRCSKIKKEVIQFTYTKHLSWRICPFELTIRSSTPKPSWQTAQIAVLRPIFDRPDIISWTGIEQARRSEQIWTQNQSINSDFRVILPSSDYHRNPNRNIQLITNDQSTVPTIVRSIYKL